MAEGQTAGELMSTELVTIEPEATLGHCAREMDKRGVGAALVMAADGAFCGIITERDLLRSVAASRHPDQGHVESWMTTDTVTIAPTVSRDEAAAIMRERNFRHLPVVVDGKLVGIVSIRDLMRG